MKRVLQNERGMALALAIVALVVVGAPVAGALFAGTQEQRVGESSRRVLTSFGVAEAGMLEVVRTWQDSTGVFNSLASYPSVPSTRTWPTVQSPSHTGAYSGTLYKQKSTRLNSSHANISYAVFCLKKKQTRISMIKLASPPATHAGRPTVTTSN